MSFRIFKTKEFDDDFNKLDKSEKIRVEKILHQIYERGSETGKPLGLPSFREKKFNSKRLYYLIYENLGVILILTISTKKAQQATINNILSHLEGYHDLVIIKLKELGLM